MIKRIKQSFFVSFAKEKRKSVDMCNIKVRNLNISQVKKGNLENGYGSIVLAVRSAYC